MKPRRASPLPASSSSFSSLYTQSTQCTAPFADCPCAISGKNIQVTGFTNIKNEQLTLLLIK
ncbi:hypothetical protein HMPREF1622_01475 [Escherichia coli A35218R]|nr:hypothetical protein HMPREF1622_01475 [Escherichia coli A35218R]